MCILQNPGFINVTSTAVGTCQSEALSVSSEPSSSRHTLPGAMLMKKCLKLRLLHVKCKQIGSNRSRSCVKSMEKHGKALAWGILANSRVKMQISVHFRSFQYITDTSCLTDQASKWRVHGWSPQHTSNQNLCVPQKPRAQKVVPTMSFKILQTYSVLQRLVIFAWGWFHKHLDIEMMTPQKPAMRMKRSSQGTFTWQKHLRAASWLVKRLWIWNILKFWTMTIINCDVMLFRDSTTGQIEASWPAAALLSARTPHFRTCMGSQGQPIQQVRQLRPEAWHPIRRTNVLKVSSRFCKVKHQSFEDRRYPLSTGYKTQIVKQYLIYIHICIYIYVYVCVYIYNILYVFCFDLDLDLDLD